MEEKLFLSPEKLLSAYLDRCRYATLGEFIKGIIHNLNGSIQILSMHMELLERMLMKERDKVTPEIQKKTEECLEQIDKFKSLVENIIQKGMHDEQDTPQMIQLNELLEEELSLLQHNLFFKHHIKVHKIFSSMLPPLKGCYFHFNQGLLNLIQNSIEAMENSPSKDLSLITETQNNQVRVIIKDTGCGIREEIKPNLFKPFFTDKGGRHQGLGLFLTQELLKPYGASFHYSSQKGETIFEVRFPYPNPKVLAKNEKR